MDLEKKFLATVPLACVASRPQPQMPLCCLRLTRYFLASQSVSHYHTPSRDFLAFTRKD